MSETSIDLIHQEQIATWYSDDIHVIARMKKLAEEHPDEVKVCSYFSINGETMQLEVPKSWFREPKPPRTRDMTDEQKAELAERLKNARENKNNA